MILQKEATLDQFASLDTKENNLSVIESDLTRKIQKIAKNSKRQSVVAKTLLASAALLIGLQIFAPKTVDISKVADTYAPVLEMTEKIEYVEKIKKVLPAAEDYKKTQATATTEKTKEQSNLQAQKDFEDLNNHLRAWMEGPLAKVLAIAMLMMGLALGVTKQSPMPAITGIAFALFLNTGPSLIANALGANPPNQSKNEKAPQAEKAKDTVVYEDVKKIKEVKRSIHLNSTTLQCFFESKIDCLNATDYGAEFKTLLVKTVKENNSYQAYYSLISSNSQKEFNTKLNSWKYKDQKDVPVATVELTAKEVNSKFETVFKSVFVKHLTLPLIFLCIVAAYYSRKKEKENIKNKEILQKVLKVQ